MMDELSGEMTIDKRLEGCRIFIETSGFKGGPKELELLLRSVSGCLSFPVQSVQLVSKLTRLKGEASAAQEQMGCIVDELQHPEGLIDRKEIWNATYIGDLHEAITAVIKELT